MAPIRTRGLKVLPSDMPKIQATYQLNHGAIEARKNTPKKFICGFMTKATGLPCCKDFKTNVDLERHEYTHVEPQDKQHECDECGGRFGQMSHLNTHKKTHKDTYDYECVCGFKAKDPASVSRHMKKTNCLKYAVYNGIPDAQPSHRPKNRKDRVVSPLVQVAQPDDQIETNEPVDPGMQTNSPGPYDMDQFAADYPLNPAAWEDYDAIVSDMEQQGLFASPATTPSQVGEVEQSPVEPVGPVLEYNTPVQHDVQQPGLAELEAEIDLFAQDIPDFNQFELPGEPWNTRLDPKFTIEGYKPIFALSQSTGQFFD